MIYRFNCTTCGLAWEADVSNPAVQQCNCCRRHGVVGTVQYRQKRSDARRPGATMGFNDLNIHTRPVRAVTRKRLPDAADLSDRDDDSDDDVGLDDPADAAYVPAPPFNIGMRYSPGGTFSVTAAVAHLTERKPATWVGITGPAGRKNTAAQFNGESATDYARRVSPGIPARNGFEWCHMVADSLGGATTAANLFCATYDANTAMLCIEDVLRGKTHLEVLVEVDVRSGTHLGATIVYRVRRRRVPGRRLLLARRQDGSRPAVGEFAETIDAMASGCTAADGAALSGRIRQWVRGQ